MTEIAVRVQLLDDLIERQLLMVVGFERLVRHPIDQRRERRIARQVGPQRQRVHEQTDDAIELRPSAARDGRADDDVVLAGIAQHQRLERGEQHDEHTGGVQPGEVPQELRHARGDRHRHLTANRSHQRGTRPIDRQPQQIGRTRQPFTPIRELRIEPRAPELLALPGGEIGILDRQRRERHGGAAQVVVVQLLELAEDDAHRPGVGDAVVSDEQQRMPCRRETHEDDAQQRRSREVEWARDLAVYGPGQRARLHIGRQRGKVETRHRHGRAHRRDHLERLAVLRHERGPKGLVSIDQRAQRSPE